VEGIWLGDGDGKNEGLEEGIFVVGNFVGLGDGMREGLLVGAETVGS